MHKHFIVMVILACATLISLTGCKNKNTAEETETDIVKTEAEYKQQAEKEINKDNMLDELDKLEKAVDQDTE